LNDPGDPVPGWTLFFILSSSFQVRAFTVD
jgi:hypothetical protein